MRGLHPEETSGARFKVLLPEGLPTDNYRTRRLQKRLEKHYGDEIIIQSQGYSSVLMNSSITLRDAVQALSRVKEEMSSCDTELGDEQHVCEAMTLHTAMGILRREIEAVKTPTEYPAAGDIGEVCATPTVPSHPLAAGLEVF